MPTIELRLNTANNFGVTAKELATVETFFYLFRFFLIQDNKNFLIQLTPTNPTSNRYDDFILTLPTDLDLPVGHYHYFVYQSVIDGSLDFEGLLELENGKTWIPDDAPARVEFDSDTEDNTFDWND